MRILVISPFFYPHIGGSQRYMEELYATILKNHPEHKVDVLAYNTTDSPDKETYKKMTIYRVSCISVLPGQFVLPNPFELISTLLTLAQHPYDLVHANTRFFESSWWAWGYAKLIGAKSMITDHVATYPHHPKEWVNAIAKLIDRTIASWALRQYTIVTTTNSKTQIFLTHTLNVPNVLLSYGGIDTTFYSPSHRLRRKIEGIARSFSSKDTIVTFAGRLIETKGPQLFLKSALELINKLPKNSHFIIAGSGPMYANLYSRIALSNKSIRIHLIGPQNQLQMKKLLQATDIFVHPSFHAEGFPNAILEAGSSECCVIATNNAGTDEIITNKSTGILVPQNNVTALKQAMVWAIINARERKKIGKNLRLYIKDQFNWKAKSAEMLGIIKQLHLDAKLHSLLTV